MKQMMIAVLVALGLALATSGEASAVPGAMCEHESECSRGELCLADSPTSNVGHCVRLHVLP
jgi:hypothetical protein